MKLGHVGIETVGVDESIENQVATRIIGASIEVSRCLGPGLVESAYEMALAVELGLQGLAFQSQQALTAHYEGQELASAFRIDLIVEDRVVVELKAVEALLPVHHAQLLTYLRLAAKRLGLLINFHAIPLKAGIKRIANNL
ncbi:MAG: GxxExxY protein [Pseudomarimonas sp.]